MFIRIVILLNSEKWSCGDLNPGPNKELICFLHAYLRFSFSEWARPKPPTQTLASLVSDKSQSLLYPISDLPTPPDRNASKPQLPGDVLSSHLCKD